MEKVFLLRGSNYIYIAIIYGLVFTPVLLSAERCEEYTLCKEELFVEGADYEMYEEFERAFEQFDLEAVVEDEDDSGAHEKGFLKKWKKKLKKWFTKKIYKIFKKITGIKKLRNGDDCAYAVAKFKRKIDKKLHNTGSIDEMFEKFDEHMDQPYYSNMNSFKEKVKFYHKNKHERPPSHNPDKEAEKQHQEDLKNIPVKAMIGGVGVACGAIIMVIPFPGCYSLGLKIMQGGIGLIVYTYIDNYAENQEKEKNNK